MTSTEGEREHVKRRKSKDYEKTDIETAIKKDNELEKQEIHFKELLKSKSDRLEKSQEKIKSLEKDNEILESQVLDLKEEKTQLLKKIIISEKARLEDQAISDNEMKIKDDKIKSYSKWKDVDISSFTVENHIDIDGIKKRFHYDSIQLKLLEENIQILEENIRSMEIQLKVQESFYKSPSSSGNGFWDNLFGKKDLKMDIEKLLSENKILKEKELTLTKLFKVHQLKIENKERQIEELTEQNKKKAETNTIVKTVPDENLVRELAAAHETILTRDSTIEEMKKRINSLMDKDKKNKADSDKVVPERLNDKFHQSDKAKMEYDQLLIKYTNASQMIERLQVDNENLLTKQAEQRSLEVVRQPSMEGPIESLHESPVTTMNAVQNHQLVSDQTDGSPDDKEKCPNCGKEISRSQMEKHLEQCLEEYA